MKTLYFTASALLSSALFVGCSLMHDDLPPCPTGLDVALRYDYNLDHADHFSDEVGAATVFVFDREGKFVTSKEESAETLAANGNKMHLDVDPGHYTVVALAGGVDYNTMTTYGGAAYRRTDMKSGDHISLLVTNLDKDADGVIKHGGKPLHNHYQGLWPVEQDVVDMEYACVEMPLMRHNKNLRLTFYREDAPEITDFKDFDIVITDNNSRITHDNHVDRSAGNCSYKPYATAYDTPSTDVKRAIADFSLSRLAPGSSKLEIRDHLTGTTFTLPDLGKVLAEGRTAPAYAEKGYSAQEYLDRQHDYELSITLKDKIITSVEVNISVLNWSKTVDFIDL